MMMEKPKPESSAPPAETEKPAAAAAAAKPKDAVADLERRLAMLGGEAETSPPAFAAAPPPAPTMAAAPPAAAAATGKNALLARIKAAQERAKQQTNSPKRKQHEETPPPPDIFSMNAPTATAPPVEDDAPPPAFDDAALMPPPAPPVQQQQQQQQQADAPPAFDMLGEAFDMQPPPTEATAPPSYTSPSEVMAPSAPAFEDLLGGMEAGPPSFVHAMPPPPMPVVEAPAQQQNEQHHPQAFAEEFLGMEGMSEEEKQAMLEEQRRIMEEIEKNKPGTAANAISAADAFDQRSNAAVARIAGGILNDAPSSTRSNKNKSSSSAQRTVKLGDNQEVALHGQEKTRAAIKDGTAILVQCVNCSNWMQVTDNASLMFCPVCQVVSPVDKDNAVATKEEALQMEADRKLAEELQNEEYSAVERQERRQQQRAQRAQREQQQQAAAAAQTKQGDSWWDWLGLGGGSTTTPTPQVNQRPQYRGDMGVSRPPGAASLSTAQTGTDLSFAMSGSHDEEDRRLLGSSGGGGYNVGSGQYGGARVAEAKPLFSCVADSITQAASTLSTSLQAQNLTQDEEGNVHGVDGSSLLVMSNAGRNQNHQS